MREENQKFWASLGYVRHNQSTRHNQNVLSIVKLIISGVFVR